MARPRRVVVTGVGVVCPHGDDVLQMFEAVYAGRSAIRMVKTGDERQGATLPLAPVNFDPDGDIPRGASVFMARAAQMAVVAAGRALSAAGLNQDGQGPAEAGIFMGSGLGGAEVLQRSYQEYFTRSTRRVRPTIVPMIMASGPASHISMQFGIRGPTQTYSVACASAA
ncbi:MAG: beta-ketoacyl-[acyl-carrier-protein] synthase II, partial [bacterium]|nr:beta-ketoacyl-[acyl-carrier-protein] synthase II [bacterium]